MDTRKKQMNKENDPIQMTVIRVLQIAAIAIAGIILMVTISTVTYHVFIKGNLEEQLAFTGSNIESLYQRQLAAMMQQLKELPPEERLVVRKYILQYNTLLLEEIDRLSGPGE